MIAYATDEDIKRWQTEGREDIISQIENEERCWAGDKLIYRNGSGKLECCSFLKIKKGIAACLIHTTRPGVCRDFDAGSSLLCPLYEEKSR